MGAERHIVGSQLPRHRPGSPRELAEHGVSSPGLRRHAVEEEQEGVIDVIA